MRRFEKSSDKLVKLLFAKFNFDIVGSLFHLCKTTIWCDHFGCKFFYITHTILHTLAISLQRTRQREGLLIVCIRKPYATHKTFRLYQAYYYAYFLSFYYSRYLQVVKLYTEYIMPLAWSTIMHNLTHRDYLWFIQHNTVYHTPWGNVMLCRWTNV